MPYFPTEDNTGVKTRSHILFKILMVLMLIYVGRAYLLQVRRGSYFKDLANKNRIRVISVPAPRGLIYDRHGTLLVNNVPEFNLYAVAGDIQSPSAVLDYLDTLVHLDQRDRLLQELIAPSARLRPIKIKGRLSLEEVARVEGNLWNLPGQGGVQITAELRRNTLYGPLAAHVLGYVGEVSTLQMASGHFPEDIRSGDRVGQFGIERTYDAMIRGHSGERWIEVDAIGQELRLLQLKKPIEGNDLFLTLDLGLQKIAEETLGDADGSLIAMDPNNGEILAMVSHPTFDPDLMSGGGSQKRLASLLNDARRPLMNRSIQGQYPPGSTFKIIGSIAALEAEEMKPADTILCPGSFSLGNVVFRDWKKGGHGSVNLHRALVESCDVYFYQLGNRLGIDTLAKFSNMFGLGKPTGIGLPNEKKGLIPSTTWKQAVLKEPWYSGETISVAIGQGYVLVTPLQMAVMMSAVANGGTLYPPSLIRQNRNRQTGQLSSILTADGSALPVLPETFKLVQQALADVVASPYGTAAGARSKRVSFAGKTGTAQVVALKKDGKRGNLPKPLGDHAWFVSYAPVEDPKIVVVALVEHGGHGGSVAAPMAKKIIEGYLFPPVSELGQPVTTGGA